jgi:hypothetical protein
MKKGIAVVAAVLMLAGIGMEAEACSASGVVGLARQTHDNNKPMYDIAREAIGTVFEDRWTKEDAYVAGVGALIEEAWSYNKDGWPGDGYAELTSVTTAIDFLTDPNIITSAWKNHYTLGSGHRVFHHVMLHGDLQERGYDELGETYVIPDIEDPWWTDEPEVTETESPIDHAG